MNFQLTKEQEFVRKMVREFAETEVEPIAAEIDKEHRFPVETVEKMAKWVSATKCGLYLLWVV